MESRKKSDVYRDVSMILDEMDRTRSSLKSVLYNSNVNNIKTVMALSKLVLNNKNACDILIEKSGILESYDWPSENLVKVLVAEMIFGKKRFPINNPFIYNVSRFRKQLTDILKNECPIDKSNEGMLVRYCRVNTVKTTLNNILDILADEEMIKIPTPLSYDEYLNCVKKLQSYEFIIDYHFSDLLVFPEKTSSTIVKSDLLNDGQIILHDKSSCAAAFVLNASPGSCVLDMCAAPGIKTVNICSYLNNEGCIYAVDRDKGRFKTLLSTIDKCGATNVKAINADVLSSDLPIDKSSIDFILLDAPCSGSGMVRRSGCVAEWEGRLLKLQNFQAKLLRHSIKDYKNAQRIVYSTCSLNEEENEAVIDNVLPFFKMNKYELLDCNELLPGFTMGSSNYKCGSKCLYFKPEKDFTNGFFIAALEKVNENDSSVNSLDGTHNQHNSLKKRKRTENIKSESAKDISLSQQGKIKISTESSIENVDEGSNIVKSKKRKLQNVFKDEMLPDGTDLNKGIQKKKKKKKKKPAEDEITVNI